MTNEEAIEIFDRYAHHSHLEVVKYPYEVAIEAFEMAISALKAQPCEDAVSREAVVALAKDIVVGDYRHRCIDPQEVMELPPVQPEREKGEWVQDGPSYFDPYVKATIKWYKCSNPKCGHSHRNNYDKYCPYCGADMREGDKT